MKHKIKNTIIYLLGALIISSLAALRPRHLEISAQVSGSTREGYEWLEPAVKPLEIEKTLNIEETIYKLTSKAGYSLEEQNMFYEIARYESTFNPKAVGYAGEFYGLFQIYSGTWDYTGCEGDIFNAIDNTKCAIKIQKQRGWTPWEVYTVGLIN